MESVLAMQQVTCGLLANALSNFKKIGRNNLTPAKVRSRISSLKGNWETCRQQHSQLLVLTPLEQRKAQDYFTARVFEKHEEICQETLDYMHEALEEVEPTVKVDKSPSASSVVASETSLFSRTQLPPIKLPPFAGKAEEWESFRDRFTALIINNRDLSNFSRIHFLVSSLTDEAREAISGINITADNFEVAWKALQERYENKRRLIETHVSSLCNLKGMSRESARELHAIRDQVERAISALRLLKRTPEEMMSDMVVFLVTQRLDLTTRRAWKLKIVDTDSPPSYEDLLRFLSSRAHALDEIAPYEPPKSRAQSVTSATTVAAATSSCPVCKQLHFLNRCPRFGAKSPCQRRELVVNLKRCVNCLGASHSEKHCRSKFTCRVCNARHHTLLHADTPLSQQTVASSPPAALEASSPTSTTNSPSESHHAFVSLTTAPKPVILSTATVTVRSSSERAITVRALLDSGSEVTFMTERTAQNLRVRRIRTRVIMSGINCIQTNACRAAAEISISPRDSLTPSFNTTADILPSLTNYTPRLTSEVTQWHHLSELKMADLNPLSSEPIDLIIGSDLYSRLLVGARCGASNQPSAINTHLGWILSGPTAKVDISSTHSVSPQGETSALPHISVGVCSLDRDLQKFWEIEEIPSQALLSPDDDRCEKHFAETHSRDPDGKYIVRLPFRSDPPLDIGDSRGVAERRLRSLVRRLDAQPDLRQQYQEFLSEYESLRHMSLVAAPQSHSHQTVFIPHHPVLRSESKTTKLRVVFDASSATANGSSLNDHLLTGPKLQADLSSVLLRWRQFKFVYAADITKMYRQIVVNPRDRCYQHILWVDHNNAIQEYELNTVTYGTASAPFLALRTLVQLRQDEGVKYPRASSILTDNTYVDDVLFGADDQPTLIQARTELCSLLKRGGFELRKWSSNRPELLADIDPSNSGLAQEVPFRLDDNLKVLGVTWSPARDWFRFNVEVSTPVPVSKRQVLSVIARFFDPLGWVTPAIIAAKILMQELWKLGLEWDSPIPASVLERWRKIYLELPVLRTVQIPRWTGWSSDTCQVSIHGFADASTVAYAAVVYARVESSSSPVTVTLLAGKSKVAPLKNLTVPRLELSAALLLTRLIEFVVSALRVDSAPIHCWTDSTVTLAWLSKHPSVWKTFVANRVSSIQTRMPSATWHYVNTHENPADCASRGLLGSDLVSHPLWWSGPPWLILSSAEWPRPPAGVVGLEAHGEERQAAVLGATCDACTPQWDLAGRFSWWPKLIRVTAYVQRFVESCRGVRSVSSQMKIAPYAVTASEYHKARQFWLK
ncbi:PREDICTED: uncharacterized protein LOC105569780, partial [Vollenhovia emeryi]|uniref:uncharacterized protein LOC105569780 n=1 Tax=Vollenhovia emeryi TaxID=411798 RepID=UPI0005F4CBF7